MILCWLQITSASSLCAAEALQFTHSKCITFMLWNMRLESLSFSGWPNAQYNFTAVLLWESTNKQAYLVNDKIHFNFDIRNLIFPLKNCKTSCDIFQQSDKHSIARRLSEVWIFPRITKDGYTLFQ